MKDTKPAHRNAHPDCQVLVVGAWQRTHIAPEHTRRL